MSSNEINNAKPDRFFDGWRVPITNVSTRLISEVIANVQAYEQCNSPRQRKRREKDQATFETTIGAVILDLVHVVLTLDERPLAISRSNRDVDRKNRYKPKAVNKVLRPVLDLLTSSGWIEQRLGYRKKVGRNQRTTVRPSSRLVDLISDLDVTLYDLGVSPEKEVLTLRADKEWQEDTGKYVSYPETEETHRLRQQVQAINEVIAGATILFDDEVVDPDRIIDVSDRMVKRCFNRRSFQSGGRLCGGFWQGLNTRARLEGITINGEPVAYLDYGQIGPRILYGLAKAELPERDLYDIPGIDKELYRPGIKKVMSTLMFDRGLRRSKPKGTSKILPPSLNISEIVQRIKQAHPGIAHLFCIEIGHTVQFIESEVLIRVLLTLRADNIVALPVHDALVVPCSAKERTTTVMRDVFKDMVGVDGAITCQTGRSNHSEALVEPRLTSGQATLIEPFSVIA